MLHTLDVCCWTSDLACDNCVVRIAVGRAMRSMLYGVEPGDPVTLATVAVGVALAACAW
jgi:hypothetical protein